MEKLFNKDLQKQIGEFLTHMKNNVTLVLFIGEKNCETCEQTKMLLEEVSELNDKITLEVKDIAKDSDEAMKYGVTMVPSFVMLDNEGHYQGVKFNGIPAGHEINSFLSGIIDMSGAEFIKDKALIERIKKIDKPVNIKVFITLSCPHCPGAVSNAHRLAMLNPNIESEMIEAQTFYELSTKYNVSGVPKIVINETHELVGNQPIEEYLKTLENL